MTDVEECRQAGGVDPQGGYNMHSKTLISLFVATVTVGFTGILRAQTAAPAAPPPYATTKVEGTDNVYVFRYQNHQSMFVVTPAGVIATDPISYGRPQAAVTYVAEIKKITDKPIKYLIYSHHHYDHIAGGKPFKDAGAKIIAHKRAKERLVTLTAAGRRHSRRSGERQAYDQARRDHA